MHKTVAERDLCHIWHKKVTVYENYTIHTLSIRGHLIQLGGKYNSLILSILMCIWTRLPEQCLYSYAGYPWLRHPQTHLVSKSNCEFLARAWQLWNSMPEGLWSVEAVYLFKSNLQTHLYKRLSYSKPAICHLLSFTNISYLLSSALLFQVLYVYCFTPTWLNLTMYTRSELLHFIFKHFMVCILFHFNFTSLFVSFLKKKVLNNICLFSVIFEGGSYKAPCNLILKWTWYKKGIAIIAVRSRWRRRRIRLSDFNV